MVQIHLQCLSSDGISENTGCRSGQWSRPDRVQPLVCGSCHSASPESRGMKSHGVYGNENITIQCLCERISALHWQIEVVNHKGHLDDDIMPLQHVEQLLADHSHLIAASVYFCFSFLLKCPLFLFKPHPSAKVRSSLSFLYKLSTLDERSSQNLKAFKRDLRSRGQKPSIYRQVRKMRPRVVTHSEQKSRTVNFR